MLAAVYSLMLYHMKSAYVFNFCSGFLVTFFSSSNVKILKHKLALLFQVGSSVTLLIFTLQGVYHCPYLELSPTPAKALC